MVRTCLLFAALLLTGCPAIGEMPCGYDKQTEITIHTGVAGAPARADSVTCQVGSDEPIYAHCRDESCTVWRCSGQEGRVLIIARAGGAIGSAEVPVSQGPCDDSRPEVAITIGG
ncbi:MAG: hypothetical protein GY898_05450 [Proteobacteria bacterium]|nr:hypothetical protein [Pseudomonadota bacterium]